MRRDESGIVIVVVLFLIFFIFLICAGLLLSTSNTLNRTVSSREATVLRNAAEIGVDYIKKNIYDHYIEGKKDITRESDLPDASQYTIAAGMLDVTIKGIKYILTSQLTGPITLTGNPSLPDPIIRSFPLTVKAESEATGHYYIIEFSNEIVSEPITKYFIYTIRDLEVQPGTRLDVYGSLHGRGGAYLTPGADNVEVTFGDPSDPIGAAATKKLETERNFYRRRKFDLGYFQYRDNYIKIKDDNMLVSEDGHWGNLQFDTRCASRWGQIVRRYANPEASPPLQDLARGGFYHKKALEYGLVVEVDSVGRGYVYIMTDPAAPARYRDPLSDPDKDFELKKDLQDTSGLHAAIYFATYPGRPNNVSAFTDGREGRKVKVVGIDIKKLYEYFRTVSPNIDLQQDIIYITMAEEINEEEEGVMGEFFPAVLVKNADEIYAHTSIVTDAPLYVSGNVNCRADGSKYYDLMFASQCLTLVSPYFCTAVPVATNNTNIPKKADGSYLSAMTVNAAIVAGNKDTYVKDPRDPANKEEITEETIVREAEKDWTKPGYNALLAQLRIDLETNSSAYGNKVHYNGGLENFVRFLEKWESYRVVTVKGCFIDAFNTVFVDSDWSGQYYTPSRRVWRYENMANAPFVARLTNIRIRQYKERFYAPAKAIS
ncbi:MAG: hypothetical protein ACM3WV_11835 [Bacillota bacterium]